MRYIHIDMARINKRQEGSGGMQRGEDEERGRDEGRGTDEGQRGGGEG